MIYNHQLCLIPRELWPWTVRSISDWKNEYHPECATVWSPGSVRWLLLLGEIQGE